MARTYWICMAVLLILASIPLFMRLDALPLFIYDEARLANNALEMARNGDWLVTHYNGEPDLWNTKPPLTIWVQIVFMKIFGFDTLGLRLPSALAGLAAILLVFHFTWRRTHCALAAMGAGMVLTATMGFITLHVTRTGDYDAMLALWSLLFLAQFFEFLQTGARRQVWYALLFFTLAVLTKGIVVFLFLPAVFLYLALRRQLGFVLRQPHFYYAAFASVAAIAAYYLGREWASPGYLKAVAENELWGRYMETIESHKGPWYLYFKKLWEQDFSPWAGFLPVAVWYAFRDPNPVKRHWQQFLLIAGIGFLLILSFSETKILWYAAPVFPLLSMAIGGSLGSLAGRLQTSALLKSLLLFAILVTPYVRQIEQSYVPKDRLWAWEDRQYASMMKDLGHWPGYTIVLEGYNAHVHFYRKLALEKGQVVVVKRPEYTSEGEFVLICKEKERSMTQERWALDELYIRGACGLYRLKSR